MMTKVKIKVGFYSTKLGVHKRGEILEINRDIAYDLVKAGLAEEVEEPRSETVKAKPKTETKKAKVKKA